MTQRDDNWLTLKDLSEIYGPDLVEMFRRLRWRLVTREGQSTRAWCKEDVEGILAKVVENALTKEQTQAKAVEGMLRGSRKR